MINVLFFARIREQLGVAQVSVPCSGEPLSLATLRQQLIDDHDDVWRIVLTADNIVMAVNQEIVHEAHRIVDGDEVAFFPPVTGG